MVARRPGVPVQLVKISGLTRAIISEFYLEQYTSVDPGPQGGRTTLESCLLDGGRFYQ